MAEPGFEVISAIFSKKKSIRNGESVGNATCFFPDGPVDVNHSKFQENAGFTVGPLSLAFNMY